MAETEAAGEDAVVRRMIHLQAQVCYMNVDRTLATWTRTALALMVFGFVVDHFGMLLLHDHLLHAGTLFAPNPVSTLGGEILVALGIFIVVTAAVRHEAYKARWDREFGSPEFRGPWLAFAFAVMVAAFGSAIVAVLLVFAR